MEYLLHLGLRIAAAFIRRLEPETAERLGAWLGSLTFHLGFRRSVSAETLRLGLKIHGPLRRSVALDSYRSMGANFFLLFSAGARGSTIRSRVVFPQDQAHRADLYKNAIFLTSHLGAWDIGGACLSQLCGGNCIFYGKIQRRAMADSLVVEARRGLGIEILPTNADDPRAAVQALRVLKNGGSLGLLGDQGPRPNRGFPAFFLGVPTYTHAGPAFFAERTGRPIIPSYCVRTGWGKYLIVLCPPIYPCGDEVITRQRALDSLSAMARRHPRQYFWQHRRFKFRSDPKDIPQSRGDRNR
jgi:KDO2-lipid IV(A) lauroyltransferase